MRTILLSLVVVAAAATTANANIWVWWQLDSGDGWVADQGQNKTLMIETPLMPPNDMYFEFELAMYIATDGTDEITNGCRAYRNNIWRGPDYTLTMQGDPMDGLLNPMGWRGTYGWTFGSQNNGDSLIMNYGRNNFWSPSGPDDPVIWQGNSPLKVITMTLRIYTPYAPFCETHQIWQSVGSGLYAWLPTQPMTLNQVFFGANPWVDGNTAVATFAEAGQATPVITIHAIPEPASLALLGLGLAMLLRRPRAVGCG